MRLRGLLVSLAGGLASEGSPLCELLLGRHLLRGGSCNQSVDCSADQWRSNGPGQRLVVLSLGHNGFGNQLHQHSVGYLAARALGAAFYVDTIDVKFAPAHVLPPNTIVGATLMDRLLGDEFKLYLLNHSHPHRRLCDEEAFFLGDRPRDRRLWDGDAEFRRKHAVYFHHLLTDVRPRCLKLVGFFQDNPVCDAAIQVPLYPSLGTPDPSKRLWARNLRALRSNFSSPFGRDDVSVYLRCAGGHYPVGGPDFYRNILGRLNYTSLWLFLDPSCTTFVETGVGSVGQVFRYLRVELGARPWESAEEEETDRMLADFLALTSSPRLILPPGSTWAFWAGLLSEATEVHVDAATHKPMLGMPRYVYHHEGKQSYFGRLVSDAVTGAPSIEYRYILNGG